MVQKISRFLAIAIIQLGLLSGFVFASTQPVYAALLEGSKEQACAGTQLTPAGNCEGGTVKIEGVIRVALNLLSLAAGIAAVIMLIIAGIRYATSGGDSGGVSGAKNTIIYAIIGIAIVAMSQLIVRFVIARING